MKKHKPLYVARKHPNPTPMKRWACVDRRDGTVVSEHYFRKNAIDVAGLSNSVAQKYGEVHAS